MEDEKKAMSVSEARALIGQTRIVTSPSGITFKVRRLTPMDFLQRGLTEIPNEFYQFISDLVEGKNKGSLGSVDNKKNLEIFEKFMLIVIDVGVIEPPLVFKYEEAKKDSHLLFMELTQTDQAFLVDQVCGRT